MSDHSHYDYASTYHDHHGAYAEAGHGHQAYDLYDVAEKHHRHYDDESTVAGLREDLSRAEERIRELEDELRDVLCRLGALEDRQPDDAATERIRGLEEQHASDLRRLWSHISNMPGGV
jgi:predicted  nucleic acid-binding Zn-ribbon protein